MTMHRILCSLALVGTACGVKSVGDLDDTDGGSGGATEASDTASASASASASDTDDPSATNTGNTTVVQETGDDEDSTGNDDGSCPPFEGSICDPQEAFGQEATQWTMDGGDFLGESFDVQCAVTEKADDGVEITITMECDEEELSQHTLVVPRNPLSVFNLGLGETVQLTYEVDPIFWINQWFTLRRQGGELVLGGVSGSALLPDDGQDFFEPLSVTLLDDVCPVEPDCGDPLCGPVQRQAIGVALGQNELVAVYDGNITAAGDLGFVTVIVGEAFAQPNAGNCDDIPPAWYSIMIYDSTE